MITTLHLVRHGESEGNVAAAAAHRAGAQVIDVPARDADVELSQLGVAQARGLGAWLAQLPEHERPQAVWASPYVRAYQTALLGLEAAGLGLPVRRDERLRDRELGILDMLTARGVDERVPLEAERRRWLGKFYYRPPGGESWADLALRVRSLLADLDRPQLPDRGLVVCHDAVIMVIRYVCEQLTEAEVLEEGRRRSVRNASVTTLVREPGADLWTLQEFDAADHLADVGVPATEHPGTADVRH